MRYIWLLSLILLPLFSATNHKKLIFKSDGAFSKSELYDAMGIETPAWYQFWKEKTPSINPKLIPTITESLGYFYRSEGFYHSTVKKEETNSSVTFIINEGTPVIINEIAIESDEPIQKLITLDKGERFRAVEFSEVKKEIKTALLNKGYCNYILDAKARVDIEKDTVNLYYVLQKNPPCYFGKIEINTPPNIHKKIVKSRLTYKSGSKYSLEKVNRSYSTISGLEAFDGIQINQDKENNIVHTGIGLREKVKKTRFEVGVGYETDIGPRGIFRWEKRNFAGDARKVAFDFKYSATEKFATNTVYWPAFLQVPTLKEYYLDLKNEFTYSKIEYENFLERKYANYLHLLKDYDWFSVDIGLGLEKISIDKLQDVCNVSDGDFNLFFPFGKIAIDLRDSKINPRNGIYLSQYLETGVGMLENSSTYSKGITEARAIKTIGDFTLAAKGKLGLIRVFENELPESKLFFAGGAFSNRGYGYNSLGAFDASCNEVGGETLIDTTLEMSHPLYKKIEGALFWDSTLLSQSSHRFSIDFVHSIGTGIRYISPIGPVKFDIGMDVDNNSQYAMHFQIGQSF